MFDRPSRRDDTRPLTLNLTPMIDVIFQLMIVFLCSMKFRTLDMKIEAQLPKDASTKPTIVLPQPPEPDLTLRLRRTPGEATVRVQIEDERMGTATLDAGPWEAVERRLRFLHERLPDVRAQIHADPDVPHQVVIRAVDAFTGAGMDHIRFRGTRPFGP